ncbi:hypothetical protein CAPTEDRAFT_159890 [Capitella teleta]|uniref:Uncharacterized protein n=1 Tax=Capitella teleta TaxID=283909 RepID=R7V1P4_CAPTE|nr:hypothetical protein CAPTEDRAFT_159890 [Capitella teleta]|eukprot:ELU12479.1 hypothetical protein CAPTEDRAFT_159890 [Capitella teleta]
MNGRAKPGTAYVPTRVEQLANMVTHGLWIPPSVLGIGWMLYLASTPLQSLAALVYGLALIALFSVSTIFHTISYSAKCSTLKNFFHIGDRAIIYVFIAASYTPWLALKNFDGWGTLTLWIVWIAAMLGIAYQYTFHEQFKWLETLLYVLIGVLPSVVIICMEEPRAGLYEMAIGGAVYISGVFFFKCDGVIPFAHAIWHCFVSIGACLHFIAVCVYLLGPHNEVVSAQI